MSMATEHQIKVMQDQIADLLKRVAELEAKKPKTLEIPKKVA